MTLLIELSIGLMATPFGLSNVGHITEINKKRLASAEAFFHPPHKRERRTIERKKKTKSFFSPPQPPTRRDFHREAEDKPACRQPRFLRFPRVNYFFLFFSVLRYALLHLTILSSLDLPYPNLTYPILPWVATWLTCGCHLVVIPQNGLWSGEGWTGRNWNTQCGVQNEEWRSSDWGGSSRGGGWDGRMHRSLWKGHL